MPSWPNSELFSRLKKQSKTASNVVLKLRAIKFRLQFVLVTSVTLNLHEISRIETSTLGSMCAFFKSDSFDGQRDR
jgi:hypothetical protein